MSKYTEQAPLALTSLPPPPRHHTLKSMVLIDKEDKTLAFNRLREIGCFYSWRKNTLPERAERSSMDVAFPKAVML